MATIQVKDATGTTQTVQEPAAPGQAPMAASKPVVIASDQSAVPVSGTVTANLGTLNGAATAANQTATQPRNVAQLGGAALGAATAVGTEATGNVQTVNAHITGGSVAAKQDYQDFPASTVSTAIKGQAGASGAAGDWLDFIEIFPETTAAGAVTLQDGTNTAVTIWAGGGTTALTSLVPFSIPIRANSHQGAWKVVTGANVHIRAVGNFT